MTCKRFRTHFCIGYAQLGVCPSFDNLKVDIELKKDPETWVKETVTLKCVIDSQRHFSRNLGELSYPLKVSVWNSQTFTLHFSVIIVIFENYCKAQDSKCLFFSLLNLFTQRTTGKKATVTRGAKILVYASMTVVNFIVLVEPQK